MAKQSHDSGVRKRAPEQTERRRRKRTKRNIGRDWCRTRGHAQDCSCVYA